MAFIFVPNADGSFTEGDKQTNPDTGIEYIYSEGAWRALGPKIEDEFDTLDDRYLKLTGGDLTGGITIDKTSGAAITLSKNGAETTKLWADGTVDTPNKINSKRIAADGPGDGSRVIEGKAAGTTNFWVNDNGQVRTNFELDDSSEYKTLTTKQYVDDKVSSASSGVPVGSIMMWINGAAPAGWFKLKGSNFDINAYPLLHAYLQQSQGYVSGILPDWRGHYPGQLGDHLNGDVGIKLPQRTAKPSGGSPKTSYEIPDGTTRTFTATGNTNAYSAGLNKVTIDSGWDDVTRPKTVAVHFIIKHD